MNNYRFHEFKHSVKVPDDINEYVEKNILDIFGNEELVEEIKASRKKRFFGQILYLDKDRVGGCEINMVNGIIPKFELTKCKATKQGGTIITKSSIRNKCLQYIDSNNVKSDKNKQPQKG